MKRAASFAVCLAVGALLIQLAQADTVALRVHGTVKTFDGQYLTITADSGRSVVLGLQPATRIVRSVTMTVADLKPGYFVGTVSTKSADGVLHAQAVRVFPPTMLGSGEGQYPLDTNPSRIVTNATVTAVTVNPTVGTLALSFHGSVAEAECSGHAPSAGGGCVGNVSIQVARGVPITQITSGDTSMLQQGAIVSALATTDPTSLLTATSITVEKDGKLPPAAPQ